MVVAVDEAWNDRHSMKIDDLAARRQLPGLEIAHRAEADDAILFHLDPAVADHIALAVDGDEVAVFQEQRRHQTKTSAACNGGAVRRALRKLAAPRYGGFTSMQARFLRNDNGRQFIPRLV